MSNELSLTVGYGYAKNGDADSDGQAGLGVTVAGNGRAGGDVAAATGGGVTLGVSGLTSFGYVFFRLLDATNNVTIKDNLGNTRALLTPARPWAVIPMEAAITGFTAVAAAGTPLLRYCLLPP
jgi:hypothetical protein